MFILPALPYAYDALQPVISDRTLRFHHDKHHATYVKTTNELLEKSGKSADTLESVVIDASLAGEHELFNNAAQAWNHAFFWTAMSPQRQSPGGDLAEAIDGVFGDLAHDRVGLQGDAGAVGSVGQHGEHLAAHLVDIGDGPEGMVEHGAREGGQAGLQGGERDGHGRFQAPDRPSRSG